MSYLPVTLTALAVVLPVELSDRAFVAIRVLGARFAPLAVWLGAVAALGLRCLVAVGVGGLLARLPGRPGALVAAGLLAAAAALLLRGARQADVDRAEAERGYADRVTLGRHGWRAAAASFRMLLGARWYAHSALVVAGLVAAGRPASPILLGAVLASAMVARVAVTRAPARPGVAVAGAVPGTADELVVPTALPWPYGGLLPGAPSGRGRHVRPSGPGSRGRPPGRLRFAGYRSVSRLAALRYLGAAGCAALATMTVVAGLL
ncbi:TMEM165/GDT1 family protein [Micromonospora sp. NPDC049559]|uniref:TMEM165/GDT1 family protein n=1 Tax=Micromonospora sp. NPDC049559 TaxID=3155923 RepID=UPI00343EFC6C